MSNTEDSPSGQLIAEISLFLLSENTGADFVVQYGAAGVSAVQELLALFGDAEDGAVSIDARQVASPELKSALTVLVDRHAHVTPQLHRLKKFVCDLPDGTYFLLLPSRPQSSKDRLECEQLVHRLNHPDDRVQDETYCGLFAALVDRYDLDHPRTDRTTVIGNREKSQRQCRFCDRTSANGATFKSVAHALPTALGNDHLKLADECDDCNAYFGRETEPSLITMLDIPRAFLGTQGRGKNGGRPKLRFDEGTVQHDGKKLNIQSKRVTRDEHTGRLTVDLGGGATLVPLSVYRALTKIALSVVDSAALPQLKSTIEWVRYGKHADRALPLVSAAIIDLPPNPSAQIVVYRRKAEQSRLPHLVGEFRLGCYVYVFAVPFSEWDSWDLVGFFDDVEFRETFKHYASIERWTRYDLSLPKRVTLKPTLQFTPATAKPATNDGD